MSDPKEIGLEQWQLDDAERLRQLFDNRKPLEGEKRKESQERFGERCKIGTQGMVWQYLQGKRALNLPALLKFANGLGVAPAEISPTLASQLPANYASLPAEDKQPKPEPFDVKRMFADDKDGFLEGILYCWQGLSPGHKDALAKLANTLYELDKPEDVKANPKKRRITDKKVTQKN